MLGLGTEVIPARTFSSLLIGLDIVFLIFFAIILFNSKRYMTLIVGVLAGVLYFVVDYGIFYKLLGTREVLGGNTFWVLLWMSMSYGFTNFAWIWLWLSKDKKAFEWSLFIIAGWLCTALLSQSYGGNFAEITTIRGTGDYHGFMALAMFVGYAILIINNINGKKQEINIPWILAIGILVQFSWEFILMIAGIRHVQTLPIIVNSLIETNMGLPYMFFIHAAVTRRRKEDLSLVDEGQGANVAETERAKVQT